MNAVRFFACAAAAAALCGCASRYSWRPDVPEEMRTVAVPTFRNESDVQEMGAVAARQVLREVQREGTFKVRPVEDAALEVQGVALSAWAENVAYDRRSGLRTSGYEMTGQFSVSVIDRRAGKVLVDNRSYEARAPFAAGQDISNAQRDAAGRMADDLARQVVDDLLNLKWDKEGEDER